MIFSYFYKVSFWCYDFTNILLTDFVTSYVLKQRQIINVIYVRLIRTAKDRVRLNQNKDRISQHLITNELKITGKSFSQCIAYMLTKVFIVYPKNIFSKFILKSIIEHYLSKIITINVLLAR